MIPRSVVTWAIVVCLTCMCHGMLVTKSMTKPRVRDLSMIGEAGVIMREKLQLDVEGGSTLPPIVCIPGVGGSQLMAKVSATHHWFCGPSKEWFMIWLSLMELVPGPFLECWSDNFKLNYTNNVFKNATGVQIVPNDFGSTLGFEYVDPAVPTQSIYFAAIVESLLKLGYVRGWNLIGVPYDWRLSPNYLGLFPILKLMIETAYTANNNTRVAVICHSMGNLFFLSFLQTVDQTWKDTYIRTYIASSSPTIGAPQALQALTSGYDFSIPFLLPSLAKVVQRTFASNYFLLPHPKLYANKVFIYTPAKNYTAADYELLFGELGVQDMWLPYLQMFNLANPAQAPGIDTYCFYGYGKNTLAAEAYASNDFSRAPINIEGDGDGTVAVDSLTFCKTWASQQPNKHFSLKGYAGQDHVGLLVYTPFIVDVITAIFTNYTS